MRSRRALVAIAVLALAMVACGTDGDGARAAPSIADEVAAQVEDRTLIDVRSSEETAAGHLEGALLIGLEDPGFGDDIAELPRDGAYLVYCRTGARAGEAIAIMEDLGFTDVVNGGGYADLAAAGLPTT